MREGDEERVAIGVALREAGAPDFQINLGGPKGACERAGGRAREWACLGLSCPPI